jgi:tetratricopeptide (TPR) repeat protein
MKIFIISIALIGALFSCKSKENELKANLLNNNGVDFMEAKNYESAFVKFHEALALKPSKEILIQLYRNLSTVHFYLENADSSIIYSKKAYETAEKNSFYYHLNKGEYMMQKNSIKEALNEFEKAKKKEKGMMELYNNLSLIYDGSYGEEFMDLPKALENAKIAFKLNPSPTMKEQLASIYFEMDDYKKSNKLYKELMTEYPEVKMFQFEYGLSLYFEGNEEEGLTLMEEAAARDSQCKEMLDNLFENE